MGLEGKMISVSDMWIQSTCEMCIEREVYGHLDKQTKLKREDLKTEVGRGVDST